jgi:hypothetical protein
MSVRLCYSFQNLTVAVDLGRVDLWQFTGSNFQADVTDFVTVLLWMYLKYVERLQYNFTKNFSSVRLLRGLGSLISRRSECGLICLSFSIFWRGENVTYAWYWVVSSLGCMCRTCCLVKELRKAITVWQHYTITLCTALDTHNSLKHMLPQHCKTFNDVFYW